MNEQPERHWIDNVADLISGRMYNTLKALEARDISLGGVILGMEIEMTQNEERIENAVASLKASREAITIAFDALKDKLASIPQAEDLSQEIQDLNEAVSGIHDTAVALTMTPEPVVSENHDPAGVADPTIDHSNNPPIPLAGESGATDAGVPNVVPQPGSLTPATTDVPTDSAEQVPGEQAPVETPTEDEGEGDEGGSDDESDGDEDDFDSAPPAFDSAPPATLTEDVPAQELPVDQALPETTEPSLPDALPIPSDPEFVATDPVTSEPVDGGDPATDAQTGGSIDS